MGLHTIDPISGDFSVGAKGQLIENGKITKPVSGVTIASNLMDFLNSIVAVGSDLTFFGSTAAPTLVVENIVVAGE
jgi:PmbA protein